MIRRIDHEKIERADRESKLVLEAERQAREAKTSRLREQRLLQEAATMPTVAPEGRMRPPRNQKRGRKIIEID
jgi:hypothetical protein